MDTSDRGGASERMVVHVDPDLEDLIPSYLEHRRNDVATLRLALEQGDYEKIRHLGHDMKGTGGGYGLDGISGFGRALEAAAKEGDAAAAARALEDLVDYLERLEVTYDRS